MFVEWVVKAVKASRYVREAMRGADMFMTAL